MSSEPIHGFSSTCRLAATLAAILFLALADVRVQAQQTPNDLIISRSKVTGLASFVKSRDGRGMAVRLPAGRIRADAVDFLLDKGRLFGITDPTSQLTEVKAEVDALGHMHRTYSQVYKGVRVFSGVVKVHQDAAGAFIAANGDFYPLSKRFNITPTLSADQAATFAVNAATFAGPAAQSTELVIVDPGWYGDPPIGAKLAWYVIIADPRGYEREAYFIDAHRGRILDSWSMIHRVKDREIHREPPPDSDCCFAHAGTGCETPFCQNQVCGFDSFCCDVEWDAECAFIARQLCGSLCPAGSLPGPFARVEGDPPTGIEDVDAAYDYLGDTYDYFMKAFGRDAIDGHGGTIIATVDSTITNCPNAFWNGEQIVFCHGLAIDDVVAHELTHGVTQFTADLIYQNQSGQLNEAYSDIFGEMIDLFNGGAAFAGQVTGTPWTNHPTGSGTDAPNGLRTVCSPNPSNSNGVRWLTGEDATPFGGAIRDMWDPTCHGDPDRANSPLQLCSPYDGGGVHSGSGVANHAAAIMTDGQNFNGIAVTGIGPIKAGAVMYRALSNYLTAASDFAEAYDAINQAALDLVGSFPNDPRTGGASNSIFTEFDGLQVDLALQAVEMNTDGACGQSSDVLTSAAPTICANRTMIFQDDFEQGPNGWTVENTQPPTAYDWDQVDMLPFGRDGTAWFCEDANLGDCSPQSSESARHSLISPVITLQNVQGVPMLAITHYMASEGGWDGGNLRIRVNGGSFQLIPRTAFVFNPYNGRLYTSIQGNTNPLTGNAGWTGIGGRWGTSVINLGPLLGPNATTIQIRFDFGKDTCEGADGWYVDDFEVFSCRDCDHNGVSDQSQIRFTGASVPLGNLGNGQPQTFTIVSPPLSAGDVSLTFTGEGDFGFGFSDAAVKINGQEVGHIFDVPGGAACAGIPLRDRITLPANTYNAIVTGTNAAIRISADDSNPQLCYGASYVTVFIEYDAQLAADCNANGALDQCDILDGASLDCNDNEIPDDATCENYQGGGSPTLTSQPMSHGACLGSSTMFSVNAMPHGVNPASFQWRIGNVDIPGATSSTLVINPVASDDFGDYRVVVTDVCGTGQSEIATLTPAAPTVTVPPQDQRVCLGGAATLSVQAIGLDSLPLTYQWQRNGVDIPGAINASYQVNPISSASFGAYRVVVDMCGTPTISATAMLTPDSPTFQTHPQNQVGCTGQAVAFDAAASTTTGAAITYQWQRNGVDISGANQTTYNITSMTPAHIGQYRLVATACGASVPSNAAGLSGGLPSIINQPVDQQACTGDRVIFNVLATGFGQSPATYQWQHNGAAIAGATFTTYVIDAMANADLGDYRVAVDSCGTPVLSNVAHLTKSPPITWYRDADGDGVGVLGLTQQDCAQPAGYVDRSGDCDDASSDVNPLIAEDCSTGLDENCNGVGGCADPGCINNVVCQCALDTDGDGLTNCADNCPLQFNPFQENADGDALGDACDSTPGGSGPGGGPITTPPPANSGPGDTTGDADGDDSADQLVPSEVTAIVTHVVDENGTLVVDVATPDGSAKATIRIIRATTRGTISVKIFNNDGPPGPADAPTYDGFDGESALGVTLEVLTDIAPETVRASVEITVSRAEIERRGLTPEQIDVHELMSGDGAATWSRAGNRALGNTSPTNRIGDYGFEMDDAGDTVTYWVVRSHFSTFALGKGPIVVQTESGGCGGDAQCDDGVFCNGPESCDAAGQCVAGTPPCGSMITCIEAARSCGECQNQSDCDDDLFCNGVESCNFTTRSCVAGTPPCAVNELCDEDLDQCGPVAELVATQPLPPTGCAGGGLCGTLGMISLSFITLGWLSMKRGIGRRC